eukprot:5611784-Alexandrium_andersonii.AAC.1
MARNCSSDKCWSLSNLVAGVADEAEDRNPPEDTLTGTGEGSGGGSHCAGERAGDAEPPWLEPVLPLMLSTWE